MNTFHIDINFTYPDGTLGMEQTLRYRNLADALREAAGLREKIQTGGCDITGQYIRKVVAATPAMVF